ncbi:MAG: hypothetical protein MUF05_00775 [Candidatus Omnitrophica bacterium]|jgi:hypothetical protein|nr:hypothetical protein [Candidatus Omnitrophota bacterium]
MIKRFIAVMIIAVGSLFLSLGSVWAQDKSASEGILSDLGFTISGDLNFSSIYMWRGIMLDGDAVVQPGIYLTSVNSKLGKLKFGFWASQPMEKQDNLNSSEIDYIAEYSYSFPVLDFILGHTYYDFPDGLPLDGAAKAFSREAYVAFAFPKLFLSPSVYYYYDYGRKDDGGGEGSYTVLNASYSQPFTLSNHNMSLDISGHIGSNNKLYYRGKGGDFGTTLGVTMPLTKNLTCKPNISYSLPWGNISDKGNGNQQARVYGGAYLSYIF